MVAISAPTPPAPPRAKGRAARWAKILGRELTTVAITIFGLLLAGTMGLIGRWHQRNTVQHRDEVDRLLAIARSDGHH